MKYFILNINYNKKSEVDHWLGNKESAPIFYGNLTLKQIKEKDGVDEEVKKWAGYPIEIQGFNDAKRFVDTFDTINKENVVFSIGDDSVYIFRQAGLLQEEKDNRLKNNLIKFFKIDLIKKIKIKNCPLVLTSIKANRHIQSGTFRDLNDEDKYLGNTKALEHVLFDKVVKVPDYRRYLQCLSSLEFETLVAKYLEELGLFVPAYKGGFLKNYDLFCRNIGETDIILGTKTIKPGEILSVQIKLTLQKKHLKENTSSDCYFCINSEIEGNNIYDWKYLEKYMPSKTDKWLKILLDWVEIK